MASFSLKTYILPSFKLIQPQICTQRLGRASTQG